MVAYTGLRLVLFLVPFGLLLLVGVDGIWALLVAFIFSSVVSVFALSRQRDQVSTSLVARRERMRESLSQRTADEDAWDEAQRATSSDDRSEESPRDPSS